MALSSVVSIPILMFMTVMSTAGFVNQSLILTAVRIYVVGKNLHSAMVGLFVASCLALALNQAWRCRFFRALETGRLVVKLSAGPAASEAKSE